MIVVGDALELPLADKVVQTCVTSPPYWGLRSYAGDQSMTWYHDDGTEWHGALGLEPTPEMYVGHLVQVFREVRRVLKDDGTLWVNLGDSYSTGGHGGGGSFMSMRGGDGSEQAAAWAHRKDKKGWRKAPVGLKHKDLVGLPWMLAFALRADGWYLRSDIIWAKGVSFRPEWSGSVMPESVRDRPTRGHEYLFLLTKSAKYYWDVDAAKEPGAYPAGTRAAKGSGTREGNRRGTRKKDVEGGRVGGSARTQRGGFQDRWDAAANDGYAIYDGLRNIRDVWCIGTKPYAEAHFATFPPKLVEPCVRIGSRPGDVVLDPFGGSGTVAMVSRALGRRAVSVDLAEAYAQLAYRRVYGT